MTETAYLDHRWHGPPALVQAALADRPNVLGPVTLDGIAYAAVREAVDPLLPAASPPEGLSATGPELSVALLGHWM